MVTYPTLPEFQGIPTAYQSGASWVSNPSYQGGGYYSNEAGYNYSLAQLEKLWDDAGGDPAVAPDMAYIAKYDESGGRAGAWNSSGATGLFQIEWPSNFPGPRQELFTPLTNAQEAVRLYNASGFSPWQGDTYENLGVAPASSVPYENSPVPGGASGGGGDTGAGGSGGNGGSGSGSTTQATTASFISDLFNGTPNLNISEIFQRIGLIVLGGALLLLGIYMLSNQKTFRLTLQQPKGGAAGASQPEGQKNQGGNGS